MNRTHHEVMLTSRSDLVDLSMQIDRLDEHAIIAYDTETGATGEVKARWKDKAEFLPYAGAYITGLSLHLSPNSRGRKLRGFYIPVGHNFGNADPQCVQQVLLAMFDSPATHLLHHCTFDIPFINQLANVGFPKRIMDTQVARWLQNENAFRGLKTMGEIFLGEDADLEQRELKAFCAPPYPLISNARRAVLTAYPEMGKPLKNGTLSSSSIGPEGDVLAQRLRTGIPWGGIPPKVMTPYAGRDATLTFEVALELLTRKRILHPGRPLAREMALQPILYNMTRKGVSVDSDALHEAGERYRRQAEEIELRMKREYGVPGMTDASKRVIIYDRLGLPCMMRTEGGDRSVAVPALEQLQGHPVVAEVMNYGHLIKARTAYAEPFAWFAEHSADGRVHGKFSSDRTVTGRLAASGPNVMTIPKDNKLPEIRRAFNYTPAGVTRYGFDLKSAELWVMASITGDKNLIEILQEGRNMHLEMMLEVFGGEADKERPEYTIAKNVNYSMAYEAGLKPLAIYAAVGGYGPGEVMEIARRLHAGHCALFPQQHYVSKFLTAKAEQLGKLPLHVEGRYRHFDAGVDYYTALNALVQGGIGEFMKDMMIELPAPYDEMLVLQVHDELVFDGPDGIEDELHELLERISADINPWKFPMHWDAKRWSNDD